MADLRASSITVTAATGTLAIPKARKYLGCFVIAAGAAVVCAIYKGAAATAGQEVGGGNAAVNATFVDTPGFASDTDNGLFVSITGAAGLVIVRFST